MPQAWLRKLFGGDDPSPVAPHGRRNPKEEPRYRDERLSGAELKLAKLAVEEHFDMDGANGSQWWAAADAMVEFADRAIVPADPKEAEVLRRVEARLQSGKYQLPVLPATLLRVIELANRPEPDLKQVSDGIRTDAAVAGEVLSLVNSAAYAAASPIKDLHRAVVHVGSRRVRNLLLAVAARLTVFRSADMERAQRLWLHSLATAVLGRAIARAASSDPEEAFLAGLLHDVGKTVVLGLVTEEERANPGYRVALRTVDRLCEEGHTGTGARIAREWNLSPGLVEAIEQHHGVRPFSPPLVAITALGNDICGFLGLGCAKRATDLSRHPAFGILGLDRDRSHRLLALVPNVFGESAEFRGVVKIGG